MIRLLRWSCRGLIEQYENQTISPSGLSQVPCFLHTVILFVTNAPYALPVPGVPHPEKYLQGASVKLRWAKLAREEPGETLCLQSTRLTLVPSHGQQPPDCAGGCSQRRNDNFFFFFLHHPQVIHTVLLQLCKSDFSSRQRLLQDIWGSKSLECFSTGSVVKMVCSERASAGYASCIVPVWQMENQKAMLFVQGCWEC